MLIHFSLMLIEETIGLKRNSPAAAMGAHSVSGGALSVSSVGKRLVKWAELKHR